MTLVQGRRMVQDARTVVARPRRAGWVAALVATALLFIVSLPYACRSHGAPDAPIAPVAPVASMPAPKPLAERKLYGRVVVAPADAKPQLSRVAKDVAARLEQASGVGFRVAPEASQGIFLLHAESAQAPPDMVARLQGLGRGAYAARSTGDGRLLIVANADEGLIYGVYQYLERLGFRFYFPSERWTITPRLEDIERPLDVVVRPAFKRRVFSGTGGFGKGLVVDPSGELPARWQLWKLQNGFGEEFHISGHAGEDFNLRNRATLEENPEYLATVAGERSTWSKIVKLDPTNPAAVELFVKDRLNAYRAQEDRDPDGPGSFAVSVEPADGGGHCDSPACERLGSVSDRAFFFANQVARALSKEFPGAMASMYAYNLHAEVPSIDIEPNVYVTLVPYAFRRDGDEPEAFIEEWVKKKSPLSIYDYWSIPDWTSDLPEFDYRRTPAKKLRYWQQQNIEGFASESTFSAGAMGLAWYIAGHLMWDLSRDPDALAAEFFRDCFGQAAPDMQRMLQRWASGFMLSSGELHASFADLASAFQRATTPEVTARLVDYAGYLQYLRLRHEWKTLGAEGARERKRALIEHLWRLHGSAMVHSFRLQKLLVRGDKALASELDPKNAELPIWRTLTPLGEPEARALVAAGVRDFPNLGVSLKAYAGELVPVERGAAPVSALVAPPPALVNATTISVVGSTRLELSLPPGTTKLPIHLRANAPLRARLLNAAKEVLAVEELPASGVARPWSPAIPAPGTYWLDLRIVKTGVTTVSAAPGVGVELQDFRIPKAVAVPDLYFFVPKGAPRVAIYSHNKLPEKNGPQLLDAARHPVQAERLDGGHLLVAPVGPDQDGKVWVLRRAVAPNRSLRLLNAPQRFALSRGALRVPQGAMQPLSR